jgi:hypothetical protein
MKLQDLVIPTQKPSRKANCKFIIENNNILELQGLYDFVSKFGTRITHARLIYIQLT